MDCSPHTIACRLCSPSLLSCAHSISDASSTSTNAPVAVGGGGRSAEKDENEDDEATGMAAAAAEEAVALTIGAGASGADNETAAAEATAGVAVADVVDAVVALDDDSLFCSFAPPPSLLSASVSSDLRFRPAALAPPFLLCALPFCVPFFFACAALYTRLR